MNEGVGCQSVARPKNDVFVTGLTGLVGSGFLYYLCRDPEYKDRVVALCRPTSYTDLVSQYCTVERGFSQDEEFLDDICEKYRFSTLIHISNKAQIVQFAKLAVKHSIKRVILVSSTYACSRKHPVNSQLIAEDEAARIMDATRIEYIFIRPTSVFGTRPDGVLDRNLHIFTKYVKKLPLFPLFARGRATVQPVWGRDVGQGIYLALTHFECLSKKRLTVGGDKQRTFKELITIIGTTKADRRVRFAYLPAWFGYFAFYSLYYLSFTKVDKREHIDRLLEDKAFETSSELLDLGYRPESLESALKKDLVFGD